MSLRTSIYRAFLLAVLAFAPLAAHAQTDQQQIVDRARITVTDLSHDKAFGNARQLLRQARAVLIVPRLFKDLGIGIRAVSVARPSLDDVFMTFTGRTIRDAESSSADRLKQMPWMRMRAR